MVGKGFEPANIDRPVSRTDRRGRFSAAKLQWLGDAVYILGAIIFNSFGA